jgi:hypothetical protein
MPLRDLLDEHLSDIPNASAAVYNHSQRHACLSRVAGRFLAIHGFGAMDESFGPASYAKVSIYDRSPALG